MPTGGAEFPEEWREGRVGTAIYYLLRYVRVREI